jgi:hypothetical protein
VLVSHGVDFTLDLSKDVGGVVVVGLLDLLLSELGDFAGFEALLVFEKAVRTSEEAVEGDNLLQEAKFRLGAGLKVSLLLGGDLLLELSLNLVVDLGLLLGGGKGLLDEGRNFLHVGLGIKLDGLAHESHRDKCFRNLADGSGDIGTLSLHFSSRSISK